MSNPLQNIFEPTRHLVAEEVERYVQNQATAEELHTVESHLIDCPLCSDAVEGAFLLKNSKSIAFQIPEKVSKERYYWRAAAAIIIVVISCGGLLWWQKESTETKMALADEERPHPILQQEKATEERNILKEENTKTVTPSNADQAENPTFTPKEPLTEITDAEDGEDERGNDLAVAVKEEPTQDKPETKNLEDLKAPVTMADVSKKRTDEKAKANNISTDDSFSDKDAGNKNIKPSAKTLAGVAATAPTQTSQVSDLETVAISAETKTLSQFEISKNAFTEGMDLYRDNQFQDAIRKFDKAAENPMYESAAKYYLAQCFIKSSRWAKAKATLHEIVSRNLANKAAATKTLDSLKAAGH